MTPTKLLIGQILIVLAIIVASIWIATQWAAAPTALRHEVSKGAAIEAKLKPIQFRHGAGPGLAGDGRQAPVDERPVEPRIVRDDDVGGRKDLDGRHLVYDLASKVIRRKLGQFGDPGVERDARILTPDDPDSNRRQQTFAQGTPLSFRHVGSMMLSSAYKTRSHGRSRHDRVSKNSSASPSSSKVSVCKAA